MRDQIRSRIADLSALAAKTQATERRILERAERRLEQIAGRLEEIKPRVLLDESLSDEYQRLILERGKLGLVVAQARRVLG
jgi:hypothetical protein